MGRYVERDEPNERSNGLRREPARGRAREASGRGAEAPVPLFEQLAEVVQEHLTARARRPVNDLGKLARALHVTSEQLEGNLAAPWVDKAASGLDQAVELLGRDRRELLEAVERFARTRSVVYCGGALVLGIGAGRFIKSSGRGAAAREKPEPRASRVRRGQSQPLDDEGST